MECGGWRCSARWAMLAVPAQPSVRSFWMAPASEAGSTMCRPSEGEALSRMGVVLEVDFFPYEPRPV